MLARSLAPNECTAQVLACLMKKHAQLWTVMQGDAIMAAVITEICFLQNGKKVCNIWAATGTGINHWLGHMATIEAWAKENGCCAVVVDRARPGWQRLLKQYRITHITLEKEI
jgi:hypothetical protein